MDSCCMCMLIFLTKWYYFWFQIVIDLGGTVVASVKQCTHLVTRKVLLTMSITLYSKDCSLKQALAPNEQHTCQWCRPSSSLVIVMGLIKRKHKWTFSRVFCFSERCNAFLVPKGHVQCFKLRATTTIYWSAVAIRSILAHMVYNLNCFNCVV